MISDTPTTRRRARIAGASLMPILIAAAVLALAGGLVLAVYLQQSGQGGPDPVTDPEAQDRELAALQESFKEILEGGGKMKDILPDVTGYIEKYPDNIDGHILHAQVLLKMEQWSLAYPPLALAVAERPDDFELLKLTGMCAGKLSKWGAAQTHLEAASALRDDYTVMLSLGNVYYQTGQYEAARDAFLRAESLSGTTAPHKALSGLADVHDAMGDRAGADNYLRRAELYIQADPDADKWTYRLQRVRITMDRGAWDTARQMLNQIAGDFPEVFETITYVRLRARRFEHEGLPEKAADGFAMINHFILTRDRDESDVTDGYHADVLAELAYWQIKAGQTDEATITIGSLKQLNPTHPALVDLESSLGD